MTHKIEEAKNILLKQFRKLQDPPGPSLKLYQWQRMAGEERLSAQAPASCTGISGIPTSRSYRPRRFPLFREALAFGSPKLPWVVGEPIQLTLAHQSTWIQLFLWSATHPLAGGKGGLFMAPHIQLEFMRSRPVLSISSRSQAVWRYVWTC